jgi:hypothetical protein
MDEQPTSTHGCGVKPNADISRRSERMTCVISTMRTTYSSRAQHNMLWLWAKRALHEELSKKATNPGQSSTGRRQFRMEWSWLRDRVSNPYSNYGAKCGVTNQGSTQGTNLGSKKWTSRQTRSNGGFSISLIRLALIKQIGNGNVYILARKSMTVHFYTHSIEKRA